MKRYYSYIEEVIKLPSVMRIIAVLFAVFSGLAIAAKFLGFYPEGFSWFPDIFLILVGIMFITMGIAWFIVGKAASSEEIRKKIDLKYASKPAYRRFLQEIQKLKILSNISQDSFKQYMQFLQKENDILNSAAFQKLSPGLQDVFIGKMEDLDYYYLKLLADEDFVKTGAMNWQGKRREVEEKLKELNEKIASAQTEILKNSLLKRKELLENRLKNTLNIDTELEHIQTNRAHIEETLEYMAEKIVLHGSIDVEALMINLDNTLEEINLNFQDIKEIDGMMPGYEEKIKE